MERRKSHWGWMMALPGLLSASVSIAQTGPEGAAGAGELTEVVVTGSRVVTNGNDSPTPVTVVNVEEMQAVRPGTVADQLNDMPLFSGSQTQQSGIGNGGANGGNPNGAGNVLNLRNFGVTRNLVLYDGHRVSPNSGNGTVDVDMIPQMLLQRVDVVTGGASAVYGADAVTGVVNFVTDTKFKGLKVNASAGRSQQNDDPIYNFGVGAGTDLFGGRGHIMGSYEYRTDAGIDARSKRDWGNARWFMAQVTPPTGYQNARYLIRDSTRQDAAFGGALCAGTGQPTSPVLGACTAASRSYFSAPGVLSTMDPGIAIPGSNRARDGWAGSGSWFDQSLKAALKSHQLFGRFDYDFTDKVHGWFKVAATRNHNEGYAISSPTAQASDNSNQMYVFVSNPYLSTQARNAITNNGAVNVTLFRINKVFGGANMQQYRQFTEADGSNTNIDFGLSGSFGGGWKWEAAVVHGSNKLDVNVNNAMNTKKLAASLDAVVNPANGQIVCNVTLTNPTLYPGCVPMSTIFGPTITPQEAAYVFDTLKNQTNITMDDFEGFVAGSPFNNWVGPVNLALSVQARKLSYEVKTNVEPAGPNNPLDCTGLRLDQLTGLSVCSAQSQIYFQGFSYSRPKISLNVREAALEADLPLLKDKFLAKEVSLNGAFRRTDYSTSGGVNSWKLGIDWKLGDSLTFRSTRSRDLRAPTMHELYQPAAVTSYTGEDFFIGGPTVPPALALAQGNSNLKPELADTVTAGFVFRPAAVPGFSVALDGYYIKVKDAIVSLNGATAVAMQTCANSGGTSSLCDLIVRPLGCCVKATNNYATQVLTAPVNIANQWTRGADLEINYSSMAFNKHYNLRFLTTYQPHFVNVDPLGGVTTENAGSIDGNPKLRMSLIGSVSLTDNLKVSILERWRSRLNWYAQRSNGQDIVINSDGLPSVAYTNLNVAYDVEKFGGKAELYLNVQNLFDRQPPVFASPGAPFPGLNGTYPGDDGIGRYFTVGFRYRR
jgi:outer membrane receptor protein involved in Fe transport